MLAVLLVPVALATSTNALLIAVGESGTVITSLEGSTWVRTTSGTNSTLTGIATDGVHWIAVGSGGTILESADGVAWIARTSGTTSDLRAVAFGDARWVAVGLLGTIVSSRDGANWTLEPKVTPWDLYAVAFGDGRWIAVGGNEAPQLPMGAAVARSNRQVTLVSQDGSSWSLAGGEDQLTARGDVTLYSILQAGTAWIAMGARGISYYSVNDLGPGSGWRQGNSTITDTCTAMAFDGNQTVAACAHSIHASQDGENWVARDSPPAASIVHADLQWVLVGSSGSVATSPDAVNWTTQASVTPNGLVSVAASRAPPSPPVVGNSTTSTSTGTPPPPTNSTASGTEGNETATSAPRPSDSVSNASAQSSNASSSESGPARSSALVDPYWGDSALFQPAASSGNTSEQSAIIHSPAKARQARQLEPVPPINPARQRPSTSTTLPTAGQPDISWLVVCAAAILALVALAYRLRVRIFTFFVWLFTRLRQDDLLDHPLRAQIYEVIKARPGIHFREVMRSVGRETGVVRHHLRTLVEGSLIQARVTKGSTRFFLHEIVDGKMMDALAAVRSPTTRRILQANLQYPGVTLSALSTVTGFSYNVIKEHVRKLRRAELLVVRRQQGAFRLFANGLASKVLAQDLAVETVQFTHRPIGVA